MPRLRVSPCRREVRASSGNVGTARNRILAVVWPWAFRLWSLVLAPAPRRPLGTSSGHRPPTTGHCRGAEGDSPIFVASCHRNRDSPRPLLPPFPSVPEMCVSRRSAPRDNSGIATSCPARGYNDGRQFCEPPHNGLFAAHNVSRDAVMGCGDVFTTAKYAAPGVVSQKRQLGQRGAKGDSPIFVASCHRNRDSPQDYDGFASPGSAGPYRPRYSSAGYFLSFLTSFWRIVSERSRPSSLAIARA